MVYTSVGDKVITHKQFEVNVGKTVNVTDVDNKTIGMSEIGPRYTLTWRRDKLASADLFKEACKKPHLTNYEKDKARKNMYRDSFGQ